MPEEYGSKYWLKAEVLLVYFLSPDILQWLKIEIRHILKGKGTSTTVPNAYTAPHTHTLKETPLMGDKELIALAAALQLAKASHDKQKRGTWSNCEAGGDNKG